MPIEHLNVLNFPGKIFDDTTPSDGKTYSSEKIEEIAATAGAQIDDLTASTETVFSSTKTQQLINNGDAAALKISADGADINNKPSFRANLGLGGLATKSTITDTEVADGALAIAKTNGLQTALDGKELLANKDTDGTLAANSDTKYPSQKAAKTYIDAAVGGISVPTRLNDLSAATGNYSMGGNKIVSLGDPSTGNDAANKAYVDTAINALAPYLWEEQNVASLSVPATGNMAISITKNTVVHANFDAATPRLRFNISLTAPVQITVFLRNKRSSGAVDIRFALNGDTDWLSVLPPGGLFPVLSDGTDLIDMIELIYTYYGGTSFIAVRNVVLNVTTHL